MNIVNTIATGTMPEINLGCIDCGSREFKVVSARVLKTYKRSKNTSSVNRIMHICADCGKLASRYIVVSSDDEFVFMDLTTKVSITFEGFRLRSKTVFGGIYSEHLLPIISPYAALMSFVCDYKHVTKNSKSDWCSKTRFDNISGSLIKRLYPAFKEWWDRNVHVEDIVLKAQKKIFSCFGAVPQQMLKYDRLWQNEYTIKDMANMRAACFTLFRFARMATFDLSMDIDDQAILDGTAMPWHETDSITNIDPVNWLSSFGKLNRAARVTLSNLPGGIRSKCIDAFDDPFSVGMLGRPRTVRTEFMVWYYLTNHSWIKQGVQRILLNANDKQIKKGFKLFAKHMAAANGTNLPSIRRNSRILEYVLWLGDVDAESIGGTKSLTKLTEAAIRYHINMNLVRQEEQIKRSGVLPEFPTIVPVKSLPVIDSKHVVEFKLLATAGELMEDGLAKQHCVGGYTKYACGLDSERACHIFTLKASDGSEATAEVTLGGDVVQSRGPHNCTNKASKLLSDILNRWVKDWPEQDELRTSISLNIAAFKWLRSVEEGAPPEELTETIERIKDFVTGIEGAKIVIDLDGGPMEGEDPFDAPIFE